MDDINVPIFSQAKLEYTKQLVDILYMNMYDGIRSIYDDAKIIDRDNLIDKESFCEDYDKKLLDGLPVKIKY